ncbi:methyltransferase domain-containing protein [uncultured Nitratireductor sp.]|uniref:methyltransferase domain-containing protein n=1 Tax=uncultured Nitratireductor sp. TaxID=520953 RepID=UPI002613AFF4|nr:methyltransferase domain-containing protein [uncultured Nitratireductor sp.]
MTLLDRETSPARIYDERFVPALFAQWGPIVAGEAGIQGGDRVLDVACGTGALTLAAASRTGPSGAVVGLDANPEMLAVARSKKTAIVWVEGRAEALPFSDADFDAVVSQFGLMFFDDRVAALREMRRVLRPGGRMAVAVCDALTHSPAYDTFAGLLDRLFGKATGDAFRAPFALGDACALETLCHEAGLRDASVVRHNAQVRFKSIGALVSTERACVWTLGGLLDDQQFELLLEESEAALAPFRQADGSVVFDMPALILRATAI